MSKEVENWIKRHILYLLVGIEEAAASNFLSLCNSIKCLRFIQFDYNHVKVNRSDSESR